MTPERKKELRVKQGCKCFYCRKQMSKKNTTADHLVPKVIFEKFGFFEHRTYNLVGAHKRCNSMKGHQLPSAKDVVRACEIHDYPVKKVLRRYFVFKHKLYPSLERYNASL